MFRLPQLTLTPPNPSYLGWIRWKNLINLDVECEDASVIDECVGVRRRSSQQDVDMWTAKLSDFDDPFTLAGCLWRINDDDDGEENGGWRKYFYSRGHAFVWWFDNQKLDSDNPYFELLFRSLRKICMQLNGGRADGSIRSDAAAAKLEECKVCIQEALKHLKPSSQQCCEIDTSSSIMQKPKYHDSCTVTSSPWLDHNFYTALFSISAIKEAVETIHNDATRLIELAQSSSDVEDAALNEIFLRIHFNITHLYDLTAFEKSNASNPFSVYLPFVSYMEEVQRFVTAVDTACNALM